MYKTDLEVVIALQFLPVAIGLLLLVFARSNPRSEGRRRRKEPERLAKRPRVASVSSGWRFSFRHLVIRGVSFFHRLGPEEAALTAALILVSATLFSTAIQSFWLIR